MEKSDLLSHFPATRKPKEVSANTQHNTTWLKTTRLDLDYSKLLYLKPKQMKNEQIPFPSNVLHFCKSLCVSNSSTATWLNCNAIFLACDVLTNSWFWLLHFKGEKNKPKSHDQLHKSYSGQAASQWENAILDIDRLILYRPLFNAIKGWTNFFLFCLILQSSRAEFPSLFRVPH